MTPVRRAAVMAAMLALCAAPAAADAPLELADVLATLRYHPVRTAAGFGIERSESDQLRARGAFDTGLRVKGDATPVGYYDYYGVDAELRQLVPIAGVRLSAGYRYGTDKLPIYEWKYRTLEHGEARAAVTAPLLRGRGIDDARAGIASARASLDIARADARQTELVLARDATTAYWRWVGATARLDVRQRQLTIARDRDAGIRAVVASGNLPAIEGVDNQRVVAARELAVVTAQRDAAVAGLELSWYVRDASGRPTAQSLVAPPLPAPAQLVDAASQPRSEDPAALRGRIPALITLARRFSLNAITRQLATNQALPRLDATAALQRGFGAYEADIPDRSRLEVAVSVELELPFQRRAARGAQRAARAERAQLAAQERGLLDRLAVDLRITNVEVQAARERMLVAARQAELAAQLAASEREKFAAGDSTILVVNLREDAQSDAEVALVDATVDLLAAVARAQYVRGETP